MAKTIWTGVSVIALACASAMGAQAQTNTESRDSVILDEIIVTAQKREQSILDVPISVTALSGELLEDRGFNEINDLQFIAPNLTFSQGKTSRISNLAIRGVGTLTFSDSIEGSVGIVVDGVVIGRAGGGLFDFADVERIEVLRGPQGTLFGKNASAGLLNIVTKHPSDVAEFDGSVSYASPLGQFKANASVSAPIGDRAGVRLSGFYNESDRLIDNPLTNTNLTARRSTASRASWSSTSARRPTFCSSAITANAPANAARGPRASSRQAVRARACSARARPFWRASCSARASPSARRTSSPSPLAPSRMRATRAASPRR